VKIALVGPSPADRGGIAQQTQLLAASLGPSLSAYFTFARRYPRWLDPRRFQERDACESSPRLPASPALDYARPRTWKKTAFEVASSGAEALVVPWWTSFWALPLRSLFREMHALRPEILRVLLCHNVIEHETSRWRESLARVAFRSADAFIVHSEEDRERLAGAFGSRPIFLTPHPVEARPRPDRDACRRDLGIVGPLVLFLGLVRRYKGVDTLIEAAPEIVKRSAARIAIVGEIFRDAKSIVRGIRRSPAADTFLVVDRYVAEKEMDAWLSACDVVVCPYRRISGSGIAARGVAARRPIVASDLAGFHPFVTAETGALVPIGDAAALARAVVSVLESGLERFERGLSEVEAKCSWENYAAAVSGFCASARIESATIRGV
jgi:glycosyltransferase involved in cell wall biosynthesis